MKRPAVTVSRTQDTSGLGCQCSATELWQPDNHQPLQSSGDVPTSLHVRCSLSFVPRPRPLTRRNSLVNQVEFLGLASMHTVLQQYNLATFKTFCGQSSQKRYGYSNGDVREVLRNNYRSCNLIGSYHYWEISPRNSTSFTRQFFCQKVCTGWARD